MHSNAQFKKIFPFVAAVVATVFLSGCNSSTTTPPTTQTSVTPKAGSTFKYHLHETDTTSTGLTVTDTDVVDSVVASGISFQGKTNVIEYFEGPDTVYYEIESNGDVYRYTPTIGVGTFMLTISNPWLLVPYGSKVTNDTLFRDTTTLTYSGFPISVPVSGVASYLGTDQLSDSTGKAHSGGKAQIFVHAYVSELGQSLDAGVTQMNSFDPSIGTYFAATGQLYKVSTISVPITTFYQTKVLVSYHLIQ